MLPVEDAVKRLTGMWLRGAGSSYHADKPFGVTAGDRHYVVSTNGHGMLALRVPEPYDVKPDAPSPQSMIDGPVKWISEMPPPDRIGFSALYKWAWTGVDKLRCGRCHNGKVWRKTSAVIRGRGVDLAILLRLLRPLKDLPDLPEQMLVSGVGAPEDDGLLHGKMLVIEAPLFYWGALMPMRVAIEEAGQYTKFTEGERGTEGQATA